MSWLDGVSVDFEDWHFNVRPSNTEPLLRLNLESLVSAEHMAEKRDEVLGVIRRPGEPTPSPRRPPRASTGSRSPPRSRSAA